MDLEGRAGVMLPESAVRPLRVLKPDERLQLGIGLDLGAAAIQGKLIVLEAAAARHVARGGGQVCQVVLVDDPPRPQLSSSYDSG